MTNKATLGVGMVGYAFMGRAHSFGWRTVSSAFDLPRQPELVALAGRNEAQARAAADTLGWRDVETDWRALLDRDDIDLIDICTPGDSHAEIAIAALAAGKHVLCEKPLANTVSEAEAMVEAAAKAERAGVRSMLGFNYRRVPAAALARQLIADGRLGTIRQVRAAYLQDWIVDPQFPLVWRLQKEAAGSGALGDIGAHIIDLAQFMLGEQITGVSGLTETFVRERPLPDADGNASDRTGQVTVDDTALFTAKFAGGATGSFEASRFATGRKNELRIEINGSAGSLVFDMESMNDLLFYDATEPAATAGFRRILVTEPEHPYVGAWWPAGHLLGWDHSFTHEIRDLIVGIDTGAELRPSFADGLQVQQVLQAVLDSAANSSTWQQIPQ